LFSFRRHRLRRVAAIQPAGTVCVCNGPYDWIRAGIPASRRRMACTTFPGNARREGTGLTEVKMLRIGAAFAAGLLVGGFAVVFASAQTSGGSTKTSVVQMRLYTIDRGRLDDFAAAW